MWGPQEENGLVPLGLCWPRNWSLEMCLLFIRILNWIIHFLNHKPWIWGIINNVSPSPSIGLGISSPSRKIHMLRFPYLFFYAWNGYPFSSLENWKNWDLWGILNPHYYQICLVNITKLQGHAWFLKKKDIFGCKRKSKSFLRITFESSIIMDDSFCCFENFCAFSSEGKCFRSFVNFQAFSTGSKHVGKILS